MRSSTEAKNASMSTWARMRTAAHASDQNPVSRITLGTILHICAVVKVYLNPLFDL